MLRIEGVGVSLAPGLEPAPANDGAFEAIYRGAIVNAEPGRAWRARPRAILGREHAPRPSLAALGTGNPEWRVRVDSTGVWRVGFAQLAARGWPAGVPITAVTAFRRDTTANLAPAPWSMTEIPIDAIDANANTFFDDQDYLVLPVRNWADRALPTWYERRYGDAEIVWLSYKSSGSGLRVTTRPGWLGALHPSVPRSFRSSRRYERSFYYDPVVPNVTINDQLFWTDGFSDYAPIDSLTADLLDLDPGGGDVTVRATWFGRRSIPHTVTASWMSQVGETPLWTATFNGRTALTREQSFPASQASFGVNRLRIVGSSSAPAGSAASFDGFDVTYPRFYVARNNRLDCTSGGATDSIEIRLEGLVSASRPRVLAYDVTDWNAPVRLTVADAQVVAKESTWRVFLQDTVGQGPLHHYVVGIDLPAIPDAAITAEAGSSLYTTPAGGADFVIIVNDDWSDAVQPLAAFRRSLDVSTLVAKAQDVYDEFNGGRKSHFAIRRFLRYALQHWDTRFVLLVGDASEDAQGRLGTSDVDYVPTPVINAPVGIFDGFSTVFEVVPTDNWYVLGLDGSSDPGQDLLADMIIGRWTAGDLATVQGLVAKSIAYETTHLNETWRSRAVLLADDEFSGQTTFGGGGGGYCQYFYNRVFKDISLDLERIITQEAGLAGYEIRPQYLTDLLAPLPRYSAPPCDTTRDLFQTQAYTRAAVSPPLFDLLGQGAAFVNVQAYGNAYVLTHENLYISQGPTQDLDQIHNDGKPWVVTSFSAHFNNFANVAERSGALGDGAGERLVNAGPMGAIACFSSTAYEVLPFNATNHLNNHVYRAFFADPPSDSSGPPGRVVIGEATTLGIARMVASTPSSVERGAARTYELLGDPLAAVHVPGTVGVIPPVPGVVVPTLHAARPSPSRASVWIPFTLPASSPRVRLAIHDLAGRLVRTLLDGPVPAGSREVRWDGRDGDGHVASAGIYFCRLEVQGSRVSPTRRIVRLR